MHSKNKKAQSTALSTILVLAIIITIVIATYIWGKGLLDAQETRITVNYMKTKLIDIKNDVVEVSHEGINSTRIIRLDVPIGTLTIANGSHCIDSTRYRNHVIYTISTDNRLVESDSFIIIDPRESNQSCNVSYDGNSAGILLAKSDKVADLFLNSYKMWFRVLEDQSGTKYYINLTRGDVYQVSGGSYTLVITNLGTTNTSNLISTRVKIDIY